MANVNRDWPGVVFDCVLVVAACALVGVGKISVELFAAILMPVVGAHVAQRRMGAVQPAGSPPSEPPKSAVAKVVQGSAVVAILVGAGSAFAAMWRSKHGA